eukprot:CAMPEP_0194503856 /NCGR_PEP_ID=MMETSP0253-20130528/28615_1 /TAXON_ID=2966 /ORGANISM="Noctiluca scintillans" /LENGTH=59 /DNA_ID=CAMNT_0039346181 /DNA_START=102 /DNA_END=281 /DNA_ORIENTATION=+
MLQKLHVLHCTRFIFVKPVEEGIGSVFRQIELPEKLLHLLARDRPVVVHVHEVEHFPRI